MSAGACLAGPGRAAPRVAELGMLVPDLEAAVATLAAFGYAQTDSEATMGEDGRTLRSARLALARGPDLLALQLDDADGEPLLPRWGLDSHPCWQVADIDAAVAALRERGMALENQLFDRFGPEAGPGSRYLHFPSPWGMDLELIADRGGLAYEAGAERLLWDPSRPETWDADEDERPAPPQPAGAIPSVLGTAHIGIRVPDLERALAFFAGPLGCPEVLRHQPLQRSGGRWTEIPADGPAPEPDRSVPDERFPAGTRIRVGFARGANLNFEFMEMAIPGPDGVPRPVFDRGAAAVMHPAFEVDSVAAAAAELEAAGAVRDDLLPGLRRYLTPWGQAIALKQRTRRSS